MVASAIIFLSWASKCCLNGAGVMKPESPPLCLQELLDDGQMDQFHKALMELNMDSPEELQSYIQKLNLAVEQAKQKIIQAEVALEVDVVDSKPEVCEDLESPLTRAHPSGG